MIKIQNLCYSYPDGNKALNDINLDIKNNETVAIVGANGAGKSTLLLMLVGVIFKDVGSIAVDGIEIGKKTIADIRKKVGMVFQNPDDQLFMTKVYDDIAFGPRNNCVNENDIKKNIDYISKQIGIEHLLNRSSHKLSGGEKRLVAIATVLSMNPSVLLFDEPTSFLDPRARRNLINTLKEINMTKIIATHDLDMALDICNRVIVLKEGSIYADGKSIEILTDESLLNKCSLELPLSIKG